MIDILLNFEPPFIKAQRTVKLLLTPINQEASSLPLALEEVHTKDVHLIIVSEDLSFFAHEHPQKAGKDYAVDFSFPFGGKFLLYCDVKPLNSTPLVIRKAMNVTGDTREVQRYHQNVLTTTVDNVTVQLDVQQLNAIQVIIKQEEIIIPASSLGDYLGAKAHVVMINTQTKEYLHVHPMVHQDRLVLHTSFTVMGTYRVWVQFLLKGLLLTADFVLYVTELSTRGHHH